MKIKTLVTGAFMTNTYLLSEDGQYLIIDPNGKSDKIIAHIDGEVAGIILTHGHFDHIKAVDDLCAYYQTKVYLHEGDFPLVNKENASKINALAVGKQLFSAHIASPVEKLHEGDVTIGPFSFKAVLTKGHTEGSMIFVFADAIFSGDTLFKLSVGRTDLFGGSEKELRKSLKIFQSFNKDYVIYPGHGEATTLYYELDHNPYLAS